MIAATIDVTTVPVMTAAMIEASLFYVYFLSKKSNDVYTFCAAPFLGRDRSPPPRRDRSPPRDRSPRGMLFVDFYVLASLSLSLSDPFPYFYQTLD